MLSALLVTVPVSWALADAPRPGPPAGDAQREARKPAKPEPRLALPSPVQPPEFPIEQQLKRDAADAAALPAAEPAAPDSGLGLYRYRWLAIGLGSAMMVGGAAAGIAADSDQVHTPLAASLAIVTGAVLTFFGMFGAIAGPPAAR